MARWGRRPKESPAEDDPANPGTPFLDVTFLRQSLPVLSLTALGGLVAGLFLEGMRGILEALPGLLVLVPAMIGLRGNINSSLGSRLGSAIHLGLIGSARDRGFATAFRDRELRENVNGSLLLSVLMPAIAAVAAYVTSLALGLPTISVLTLLAIAVVSGVVSGIVLAVITVMIVLMSVRRGLDPDNVTAPFLATVGDVLTLVILLSSAYLIAGPTLGVSA